MNKYIVKISLQAYREIAGIYQYIAENLMVPEASLRIVTEIESAIFSLDMVTRTTYNETRDAQELLLETSEQLLTGFRNKGIRGQDRDFSEIIDVNRAAIALFDSEFGYSLYREWNEL